MLKAEYEAVVNHGRLKGIIMCGYPAKYALIFLLLALSVFSFLLCNIPTLEVSVILCLCDKVTFRLIPELLSGPRTKILFAILYYIFYHSLMLA